MGNDKCVCFWSALGFCSDSLYPDNDVILTLENVRRHTANESDESPADVESLDREKNAPDEYTPEDTPRPPPPSAIFVHVRPLLVEM